MQKKLKVFIIVLSLIVINSVLSFSQENIQNDKEVWMNNLEKKDIKIEVIDVSLIKEDISINENYPASAIITMNVTNNGVFDMELANIDIIPYQGDVSTKYFVSTSNENITGFIGNLKSKESKVVKIGVALHNVNDPIKLEMNNISDVCNEKVIHEISIK